MSSFADRVLKLVAEPSYKPRTIKALSRWFKIDPDDYAAFRAEVKGLVKEGKLDVARDKTLTRVDTAGTIIGLFRRSSKGFGFVRPHGVNAKADQIYIAPESAGDASSGDEVAVKILKKARRDGMNDEGKIVQIVARATSGFVGTYYEEGESSYVKVDGTTFHGPIYVGDPGAKGAKPGDKVAIEIVRYPTPYQEGEGVVSEILGVRGAPGVDTLTVIRAFNIPDVFDDSVLDEARQQAKHFHEDDVAGRLDHRGVLTVTIDPATARDFDDAISLERDEKGFWTLGVHIADVSHFVEPNSELDHVARKRGTSVYLPDRVVPMLPEIISNSLASLQAGHTRYTVSAFLEFNDDGVLTSKRFARSAIRVDHRFAYEQAFEVMKNPEGEHEGVAPEVVNMVVNMLSLAMTLRRRRFTRGALELSLPEVEIKLDDQGKVAGAHLASHDESHQVIEEFMLAANEAVASYLSEQHVGFLRRVHPDPEEHKLAEFAEFVRSLGIPLDLPQSRFELQKVLDETKGKPEEYAVHYGLLRSLKQAVYSPEPETHYALASDDYCHFTSPIRRYPDLQVHRQLTTLLAGKKPRSNMDELAVLAESCNRTERRAEAAERELVRVKMLMYMESKIGESFHAIVVGVEDFGLFCRLVELPVEGLIHVTSLADDFYYLEAGTHTLVGRRSGVRHRLGDRIEIRVAHVDVDRRQLDLVLATTPLSKTRTPARKHYYESTPASRSPKPPRAEAEANASPRPRRPGVNNKKKAKPKGTKKPKRRRPS
ncbi:ribonuclease R [Paludisphaera borealis]|uniref:Ribonuclease R n=1 Tax=Paludisphaera borealis TaxID=1387353 RepID=A0A1U7CQ23_9BACT|nr:ribonuclease R [Paludisphaera borealis]APW61021.1 Ribonuclease R [Paludisphaera borealis]